MTDKVQKIREEVEMLQDACMDEEGNIMTAQKQGAYHVLCNLDAFIDSLQEEPVSDTLEKEIEQYCIKHGYLDSFKDCGDTYTFNEHVGDIARHFTNWQKQQIMVNAADAMIGLPYENKDGGYTHLIDVSRPLPVGNNKIAIIFKEDGL